MLLNYKKLVSLLRQAAYRSENSPLTQSDSERLWGWAETNRKSLLDCSSENIFVPDGLRDVVEKIFKPDGSKEVSQIERQRDTFLPRFDNLVGGTRDAFKSLEFTRKNGSESDLERAVRLAMGRWERERKAWTSDAIGAVLEDPEQRFYWDTMARFLSGARLNREQLSLVYELKAISKGLDFASDLGAGLLPIPVSTNVPLLLLNYGAFATLGKFPMTSGKTKFAKISALPTAVFITPTATGVNRVIPADTTLAGSSLTPEANSVAALLQISLELASDEKADLSRAVLEALTQALASRIDYAAFIGDGTDNTTSGGQTGIFQHGDIANVSAVAGNTTVERLAREDFLSAVAAVSAAALQRPCRWWINPSLIPSLMGLKDGTGPNYLLKTPADTGGEWYLCGFPVTWTAQAPGTNAAGSKIAAFGSGLYYLVGVRDEFELGSSDGASWNQVLRQLRAVGRVRCDLREASGLAVLKTAAA